MPGENWVSFFSVQLKTVTFLELKPLTAEQLPEVVELDKICLGGIWTLEGYQRELDSPTSDLLVVSVGNDFVPEPIFDLELGGDAINRRLYETSEIVQSDRQSDNSKSYSPTSAPEAQNPHSVVGLGCLWSILDEAHITLLAVHPKYQRGGLGTLLLTALLRRAVLRGLERATLEVRASNEAARSLYAKFGFQEAGRRRHYYKDTGEDALILWRGGLKTTDLANTLEEMHRFVRSRLASLGWNLKEVRNFEL